MNLDDENSYQEKLINGKSEKLRFHSSDLISLQTQRVRKFFNEETLAKVPWSEEVGQLNVKCRINSSSYYSRNQDTNFVCVVV